MFNIVISLLIITNVLWGLNQHRAKVESIRLFFEDFHLQLFEVFIVENLLSHSVDVRSRPHCPRIERDFYGDFFSKDTLFQKRLITSAGVIVGMPISVLAIIYFTGKLFAMSDFLLSALRSIERRWEKFTRA